MNNALKKHRTEERALLAKLIAEFVAPSVSTSVAPHAGGAAI